MANAEITQFREFLYAQPFQFLGTLTFNQPVGAWLARARLKEFHGNMDRLILGRRFYKQPRSARTFFVAFPEGVDENLHYHLLIRPPHGLFFLYFLHAEETWTSICPAGDARIDCINTNGTHPVVDYATKELGRPNRMEGYILSDEFLPSHL